MTHTCTNPAGEDGDRQRHFLQLDDVVEPTGQSLPVEVPIRAILTGTRQCAAPTPDLSVNAYTPVLTLARQLHRMGSHHDRLSGYPLDAVLDFTGGMNPKFSFSGIATNPAYGLRGKVAERSIEAGLRYIANGGFLALLLGAYFDSAKTRVRFFRDCPLFAAKVVLTKRLVWFSNPDPDKERPKENHAWFIWQNPPPGSAPLILYAPRNTSSPSISETATAGRPSSTPVVAPPEQGFIMSKPTSTEKVVPISVGNPVSISQFIVDQKHMEEFTKAEEEQASMVEVKRPPRGTYFTVPKEEEGKPNSLLVFLLELPGHGTYLLTPAIAKEHSDEDVIRPILLVRYVTMLGEEALWPLKLDPPDAARPNKWNASAKNVLKDATGAWVRLISKQKEGQYRHSISPTTIEKEKPKFSNRSIYDLVDAAYDKDHRVYDDKHEVWTILAEGKAK